MVVGIKINRLTMKLLISNLICIIFAIIPQVVFFSLIYLLYTCNQEFADTGGINWHIMIIPMTLAFPIFLILSITCIQGIKYHRDTNLDE